jgi:hypothetical protein
LLAARSLDHLLVFYSFFSSHFSLLFLAAILRILAFSNNACLQAAFASKKATYSSDVRI